MAQSYRFESCHRHCAVCNTEKVHRRPPGTISPGGASYAWVCEAASSHMSLLRQRARVENLSRELGPNGGS